MLGVSNELKSGLWWASIAIAIVAVIIFAIYLIIVIWHYSLSLKEKKAKSEFNALINEINTKNFNYLETLAKKNEQLQKAIKLIADINSFYKSQLDELQLKIVDLSCIIDRYQLWRADKLHKQIKEDIHKCEQIAYTINSIYSNSTDYSLTASRILAKYRVAYNDIKDFYLNNLSNSFCQKEFINAIDKISDEITKADEFQTQLNNKELISTMNIVNEYNKKFLSLVRQSYTYSNVIQYVVDLKKQLDENLNVNQNKISKKEYSEALRVSSNVKELIKLTNKYLQQLNFDSTRISIRSIVTQLEPALNFFKQYDRIALLIDNGLGFAKISLEVIENNIGELEHSFEIINKYFANDNYSEMIIETNLIKAGLKKIHINYSELLKRNEQKEYYDRVTFLKDLFALINNIALWENSLNVLYQNIIHKYQSAIELLDKIYDLQWVLTQFIGLINGKTINVDMPTIVLAEDHLKAINLLISKLNEDYATNFNSALETIKNIEKDISNIYTIIDVESKIKDYARALIFYTNKYRLEDKEIANVLNNADELFKQNQYRKVIDTLLPTLRHIKKSAKANGYNFK